MPSSTWHGFFGGFLGATVAIGAPADWWGLLTVLVTTLVVPMLAVSLAYLLMHLLLPRHLQLRSLALRLL